jgi:hypothetical protein
MWDTSSQHAPHPATLSLQSAPDSWTFHIMILVQGDLFCCLLHQIIGSFIARLPLCPGIHISTASFCWAKLYGVLHCQRLLQALDSTSPMKIYEPSESLFCIRWGFGDIRPFSIRLHPLEKVSYCLFVIFLVFIPPNIPFVAFCCNNFSKLVFIRRDNASLY